MAYKKFGFVYDSILSHINYDSMHFSLKSLSLILVSATMLSGCALFGKSTSSDDAPAVRATSPAAAAAARRGAAGATEIKKFSDVIKSSFDKDEGMFTVYKDDNKYYYEIPDSLLGREMLMLSRIARTADGIGYGGEVLNNQTLRFERRDKQILLRVVSYNNVAADSLPVAEAVRNSNFEPIIMSFNIEAYNADSTGTVIEVTPLFATDVPALGLQQNRRTQFQVRRLDPSRSFIESVRSFPTNIETRKLVTYEAGRPPSNSQTGAITLEINHSMYLLPEEPMQTRELDERVNYFAMSQVDFGSDVHRAESVRNIVRWRLEPKDPEAYELWRQGLGGPVEPIKPIIFYVDPATPEKYRKWLAMGVDDWQVAFEAAGFKNAIMGKMAPTPEEDPDFSPEDARYTMIRYFASPIQNAYGPHVRDPRSGEILTSSIGWYHNVMNLLRNWYFIQTAAANPEARKVDMDDDVMGELVRFVSAHEVGHTLGLPHNFGSSYAYSVDSLRSPTFTANHGTAPSIMDYARFNYIAQPGDGVTNFYPQVGEYDIWSVQWGYTWFGDKPKSDQKKTLNEWVIERADDPRYFFGRQTSGRIDPRSQNEDLGDDAMRASYYGLKNLEVITDNLVEWVARDGDDFSHLSELYGQIIAQWGRYMGHVASNIGGVYEDDKTFEQAGAVYTPVEREIQKRAMAFLDEYAFSSPTWVLNEDILGRVNQATFVETLRGQQVAVLNNIASPHRLARLIEYERRAQGTYSAFEFMDDLRGSIFKELRGNSAIDVHRRNLQRAYVERMEFLMTQETPNASGFAAAFLGLTQINVSQSDIRPIAREQLETLKRDVTRAKARTNDRATRVHLNDLERRIDNVLDPK
ncbi:MAG: zinc-dependent metalloprotease [Balneolales bacterium]|nr:zinc-dependent metalloprotease [Balneolales bacterium]